MVTVAQLIEDVAEIMHEKPESVNAYARALMNSGDLPKSRGRSIARVEVEHIVKLFLAVILSPKIKNTAATVGAYFNMRRAGVMIDFPENLQRRAGAEICDIVEIIFTIPKSDDEKSFRKSLINARISIVLNWREIEISFGEGQLVRFKDGGSRSHWETHFKRGVILDGRAFVFLGFGKGRDYCGAVTSP